MNWEPQPNHPAAIDHWQKLGWPEDLWPRRYASGDLIALVGREPFPDGTTRWHISVSAGPTVPSWEELVAACHDLRPGVMFCMGVPTKNLWMNLGENVLHVWETFDEGLITSWRINADAAKKLHGTTPPT